MLNASNGKLILRLLGSRGSHDHSVLEDKDGVLHLEEHPASTSSLTHSHIAFIGKILLKSANIY